MSRVGVVVVVVHLAVQLAGGWGCSFAVAVDLNKVGGTLSVFYQ